MNGLKQDIDEKRALAWRKQRVSSSLTSSSKSINSKKDLCDSIAQSIRQFSSDVYGNENDQKYSRIADLAMLRIKSDLDSVKFISVDPDNVKALVENELKNAFADNEQNVKPGDAINSMSTKILELVDGQNSTYSNDSNQHTYSKKQLNSDHNELQISQSQHLNQISKTTYANNDAMHIVSSEINNHLENLESLITGHFSSFQTSRNRKNTVSAIDKLNRLQIRNIQFQMPIRTLRSGKKKIKKEKETSLVFDGMKFSSTMVEDLSSNAVSTALYSMHLVKRRNTEAIGSFHKIESCVEKNAKHMDEMIKKLSESSFSKTIKQIFNRITGLFKGKLSDPVKSLLLKLVLAMLPDKWANILNKVNKSGLTKIYAAIDATKKHFLTILNAFKAKMILIWKGMKKVFSEIKDWIIKTFDETLGLFKKAISAVIEGLKSAIMAVFRAVVIVMKGIFNVLVWGIRMTVKGVVWLAKYGWEKLMNSKFGGFLKRCWAAISKPFKLLGEKIGRTFRKIRIAYKKAKRAIVNKVKSLVGKIKTKVSKVLTSVKNFFGKVGGAIKRGFRKVGSFLGKHIANAFNKIPGSKYIKKMSKKIIEMIGKKLFKQKSEKIMKQSLAKKIADMLSRLAAKFTISGGPINLPKAALSLLSLAWTIYDLFSTYQLIKELIKPMAEEIGYDTSRPAWFEMYMAEVAIPKAIQIVASGDFARMLYYAIRDILINSWYEIKFQIMTTESRQRIRDENLRNYDRFNKIFVKKYGHINIDNPKNVDDFINNQYASYKLLIDTANHIKKQNEEIIHYNEILNNDYKQQLDELHKRRAEITAMARKRYFNENDIDELRNLDSNEKRLKDKIEEASREYDGAGDNMNRKMKDKLDTISGIVQYASQSGMGLYSKSLISLVNTILFEKCDDIIFELYNEAYSGIKYLELLKHKKEINERLEEKVREERIWHAEHDFDIDEFKRALEDISDQRHRFEEKAKNINEWLNNCENIKQEPLIRLKQHLRYMFKLEDEDGNIPEYDDGLTKQMFDIVTYSDSVQ